MKKKIKPKISKGESYQITSPFENSNPDINMEEITSLMLPIVEQTSNTATSNSTAHREIKRIGLLGLVQQSRAAASILSSANSSEGSLSRIKLSASPKGEESSENCMV